MTSDKITSIQVIISFYQNNVASQPPISPCNNIGTTNIILVEFIITKVAPLPSTESHQQAKRLLVTKLHIIQIRSRHFPVDSISRCRASY